MCPESCSPRYLIRELHVAQNPGSVLAQAIGRALLAGELHPLHIPRQPPHPSLHHVLPAPFISFRFNSIQFNSTQFNSIQLISTQFNSFHFISFRGLRAGHDHKTSRMRMPNRISNCCTLSLACERSPYIFILWLA